MRAPTLLAAGLVLAASALAGAAEPAAPRYLEAVRQELARLGVQAACEPGKGICSFQQRLEGIGAALEVTIACSDETDTVYVAVPRFLALPDRAGPGLDLARRLLDLNRRLVTTKLEWDALAASIRLSTVLSTDSSFDRRAFRSQLRALFTAAERLLPELEALAGSSAAAGGGAVAP